MFREQRPPHSYFDGVAEIDGCLEVGYWNVLVNYRLDRGQ